jgi:cohesin complex subunit SCC1
VAFVCVLLQANLLFSDGPSVDQIGLEKEKEPQPSTSGGQSSRSALEIDAPIRDDGFGGNLGQDIIGTILFELLDLGWITSIRVGL